MQALKTYFRQFGAIGRINASIRRLAKNNIAVGIVSPSWRKHALPPDYLSITGRTLSCAGRLTDGNILKIESLLGRAADPAFEKNMGREKILQDMVVLEKVERTGGLRAVYNAWSKIDQIKGAVRELENMGLAIPFFKPLFGSLGLRLCLNHHLSEASEFSYVLRRI